jgi:hypothetical protein
VYIALGAALCAGGNPVEGVPLLRRGRDALAMRVGPANRNVRVADRWLRSATARKNASPG